MKRYINASLDSDTSPYYKNYKVVSWDDPYEEDVHYFTTYGEALQYGNSHYNGCCDISSL